MKTTPEKYPLVKIQERSYEPLEGETVQGCIFIEYENIPALLKFVTEFYIKFNQFKADNKETRPEE